jgi:hypothetical protein
MRRSLWKASSFRKTAAQRRRKLALFKIAIPLADFDPPRKSIPRQFAARRPGAVSRVILDRCRTVDAGCIFVDGDVAAIVMAGAIRCAGAVRRFQADARRRRPWNQQRANIRQAELFSEKISCLLVLLPAHFALSGEDEKTGDFIRVNRDRLASWSRKGKRNRRLRSIFNR